MVELPVLRDLPGRGWPWIVVDAPDDLRIARTVARGAMSAAEVRRVIDRQAGRGEWLAAASWVVDNSGDPGSLLGQCRRAVGGVELWPSYEVGLGPCSQPIAHG